MSSKSFQRTAVIVMLLALFALAGCGSSPTTALAGSTSAPGGNVAPAGADPCTLLTKADAESILGKPVGDATHPVNGGANFEVSSCEYTVVGGTALDNSTLVYTYASGVDASLTKTAFDTGRAQAKASWNADPVDVPGLGDEAYWVGGAGNNIQVLKGAAYFTLSASTNQGDTPPAAILALAKTILGRIH